LRAEETRNLELPFGESPCFSAGRMSISVRENLLAETATTEYLRERTAPLQYGELFDVFENEDISNLEANQLDPNS
jgi:hypothetical protein